MGQLERNELLGHLEAERGEAGCALDLGFGDSGDLFRNLNHVDLLREWGVTTRYRFRKPGVVTGAGVAP